MNIVIGLGEIGRPLLDVLGWRLEVYGRDIEDGDIPDKPVNALHICYPYSNGFLEITTSYIEQYEPNLCIIHSTVVPGVTEMLETDCLTAYSPIRGRHLEMHRDLVRYDKYVAGATDEALDLAMEHLSDAGFNTVAVSSCRALELAKLVETTYSGLLIAWAQELERFCAELDVDREEVLDFTAEIDYLPNHLFYPGIIGGHCIIPNTRLLNSVRPSAFIDAIRNSNELRKIELDGADLMRYRPKRLRGAC
jgi:UDP-N-acetyl-D-mannosaminuronate dehydrogenase